MQKSFLLLKDKVNKYAYNTDEICYAYNTDRKRENLSWSGLKA